MTELNIGDVEIFDLGLKVSGDLKGDKIDHAVVVGLFASVEGLDDRISDLGNVEVDDLAVSFHYIVHKKSSAI